MKKLVSLLILCALMGGELGAEEKKWKVYPILPILGIESSPLPFKIEAPAGAFFVRGNHTVSLTALSGYNTFDNEKLNGVAAGGELGYRFRQWGGKLGGWYRRGMNFLLPYGKGRASGGRFSLSWKVSSRFSLGTSHYVGLLTERKRGVSDLIAFHRLFGEVVVYRSLNSQVKMIPSFDLSYVPYEDKLLFLPAFRLKATAVTRPKEWVRLVLRPELTYLALRPPKGSMLEGFGRFDKDPYDLKINVRGEVNFVSSLPFAPFLTEHNFGPFVSVTETLDLLDDPRGAFHYEAGVSSNWTVLSFMVVRVELGYDPDIEGKIYWGFTVLPSNFSVI